MKSAVYLLSLAIFLILLFLFSEKNITPILTNPFTTFGLVIIGAYISAFAGKRTSLTVPRYYSTLIQSLAGGFMMGLGFIVAGLPQLSNTLTMIHGVFYWVSFLMPQGFLYLGSVFLGGGAAALLQKQFYPRIRFNVLPDGIHKYVHRWAGYIYMIMAFIVLLAAGKTVVFYKSPWLGLTGVAFALASGFLLERNRFCMGLLMKEIYFTKAKDTLLKLVAVSVFLAVTWLYFGLKGPSSNILKYWPMMIGSFLMGFGFILADGCYMGSLWKAGQGNTASLFSVTGIFVGAGISSVFKNNLFIGWFSITQIDKNWPLTAVKIGLVLIILVWAGAYFLERPEQVVKSGSKKIWLVSEACIIITVIAILLGPKLALSVTIQVFGLLIYYAGIVLYIWARVCLGKHWGESILLRANHRIITNGPYRYVKHPIYIALTLGLTGVSILLRSPGGLVGTYLLTVPTLSLRAREEQRLLSGL